LLQAKQTRRLGATGLENFKDCFFKKSMTCELRVGAGKTTRRLGATLSQFKAQVIKSKKVKSQVAVGKTTQHLGATLFES
jgi:hypothetical protein